MLKSDFTHDFFSKDARLLKNQSSIGRIDDAKNTATTSQGHHVQPAHHPTIMASSSLFSVLKRYYLRP